MSERNQFDAWARLQYRAEKGFLGSMPISVGHFHHDDAGTLKQLTTVADTKVGLAYAASNLLCLQWDDNAAATQKAIVDIAVPYDFRQDTGVTGERSALLLAARIRKLDGTGAAVENATLKLNVSASWHNPSITDAGVESDGDTSINTLSAAVPFTDLAASTVLPTKAVAASEEKFRTFIADISSGMTTAQLQALRPGAAMTISLAPSGAPGTDLYIEVCGITLLYSRHLVPTASHLRARALRSS